MKTNILKGGIIFSMFLLLPLKSNGQLLKKLKEKVEDVAVKESIGSIFKKKKKKEKEGAKNVESNGNSRSDQETVKSNSKTGHSIPLDFGEIYTLEAPNQNFEDIKMQGYKGLPRFGFLNQYRIGDNDYFYNLSQEKKDSIKSMYDYFIKSYQLFNYLSAHKFQINAYDDEKLNIENIGNSSYIKMEGVKRIAFQAFSKKLLEKYFCNEEKGNCIIKKRTLSNSGRNPYFASGLNNGFNAHWGGDDATIFQQKRSFEDFKKSHLQTIDNWAKQLWDKETKQAFFVFSIGLDKYDFDKKGYWIKNILSSQYTFGLGYGKKGLIKFNYQPKYRYEKEPKARKNKIFFKMSAEKAEDFENREIKRIYIVQKVGFRNTPQGFVYYLDNPILELYEDIMLKVKVGEVLMTEGVFR